MADRVFSGVLLLVGLAYGWIAFTAIGAKVQYDPLGPESWPRILRALLPLHVVWRLVRPMLTIPPRYLAPLIGVLVFVGVYAVVGNAFDLKLAISLGVLGWILRKLDHPLAPVILGFVLGGIFENNLRRALSISAGDRGILFQSFSKLLYALTVAAVVLPSWFARRRVNRAARA